MWNTAGSGGGSQYLHNNDLGTLQQVTDIDGYATSLRVFTAFGERVAGPTTLDRFGYVGDEGYQADAVLPFLHVGARYYDPTTGRFLQRDPSGIEGGTNVYEYAWSSPVGYFDPDGLQAQPSGTAGAATNPNVIREVAGAVKDVEAALGKGAAETGAKSAAEYVAHKQKLDAAKEMLKHLQKIVKDAPGKKARDKVASKIADLTKQIKGHEKEMSQKWPTLCQ